MIFKIHNGIIGKRCEYVINRRRHTYMKINSTSLVVTEMEIKSTVKCHFLAYQIGKKLSVNIYKCLNYR